MQLQSPSYGASRHDVALPMRNSAAARISRVILIRRPRHQARLSGLTIPVIGYIGPRTRAPVSGFPFIAHFAGLAGCQ